jgi:hypothetical protein
MMPKCPGQQQNTHSTLAFPDYFRCPGEFAGFQVFRDARVAAGFFRFGPAMCFGNSAEQYCSKSPNEPLFDALSATEASGSGEVRLPFNPTEVVENVRRERYLVRNRSELFLHSCYYLLRPILLFSVRKILHRYVSRWRRTATFPAWPVDRSVDGIFRQLMALAVEASGMAEVPFIWFWPDGHESAMMMTHDVEDQKGSDHCDFLMDVDDSFGMKAAFQLIPEGGYEDFDRLVAKIRARGYEVNIHDLDHDGRLYEHKELFETRASRINEYGR